MGIDRESDVSASLQVGPTSLGMVRLYIETESLELPLDFEPGEAEEIAEEILAAAARARSIAESAGEPAKRGEGDGQRTRRSSKARPPRRQVRDKPGSGSSA